MSDFIYRIIRFLNRFISFTPEYIKNISSDEFVRSAEKYIGFPYVLGGDGSSGEVGIDCSHLISRALIDAGSMENSFYRTARYLVNITTPVQDLSDVKKGDLLLLYDETDTIGHVAIIIKNHTPNVLKILDASGPSTGIWSTTYRDIDLTNQKYILSRLNCLD